jgi:lysophospholipase L1-like esterase
MKRPKVTLRRVAICLGLAVAAMLGVLWFHNHIVYAWPIPRFSANWRAQHQAIADRLQQGHAQVLWIGDSIVERFAGPGQPVWDRYYGPRDAVNMGISGDKTQHVLWRLDHCPWERVAPKLAIVMIGQNNGPRNTAGEIAEGVTAIVGRLRGKAPGMKILLLGIFYRGEKPNEERVKLAQVNEKLSRLADGEHVFYMNINGIFVNPDGTIRKELMPDFEHPNEAGCRAWAEAIESKVAELLGEKAIAP